MVADSNISLKYIKNDQLLLQTKTWCKKKIKGKIKDICKKESSTGCLPTQA